MSAFNTCKSSPWLFDWVLAFQCLYWSEDLPGIVRCIGESATNALIVIRGERGIYEIQSQFKNLVGNPKEQYYSADYLERVLIDLELSFSREDHATFLALPPPENQDFR